MTINSIFQDLLNISFWDSIDFRTLVIRYTMHLVSLVIAVRVLYFESSKRKDYLFTYFLISTVVFLLCYMLANVDMGIGMALSLFAIFGIIRYRTGQIPIREMTYLFIVIGLAVINALANYEISFFELLLSNLAILITAWLIEKAWSINPVSCKVVQYDKIENIKPEMYSELQKDLEGRLGLAISKVEIGNIDLLRDTAQVVVYYKSQGKNNGTTDNIHDFIAESND